MEYNIINVYYDSNDRFGEDNCTIEIKNTSYGAMRLFQKDLEQLSNKQEKENKKMWHPVTATYSDLLSKLSKKIKIK